MRANGAVLGTARVAACVTPEVKPPAAFLKPDSTAAVMA